MNIVTSAHDPAALAPVHFARLPLNCVDPLTGPAFDAAGSDGITLNYEGGRSVHQRQKSWAGVSASIAQLHCDGELYVDLGADAARLSVVLDAVGGRVEIRARNRHGELPAEGAGRPLSIIPAALPAYGKADHVQFLRHLVLQFDVAALRRMGEDEVDPNDVFAPRMMFADPGIMHLAQLFANECVEDAPHSQLYGDTLSMALLLALSRLGATRRSSIAHGHLAPWQLRRVSEYIDAHLAEDIQLLALSDLVKLSRSYFSRAFKKSTGLAPHQWLLRARIAKAKQLMLEGDRPLALIAVGVGFADQAHFTRTFGRAVGESPAVWRRNRALDV
jgi:AraC family transcriptional regulator